MPGFLRQSTASQSRALGPFIDDTDFKTPETGLTIANTDIKLVVNGGASANKNSGGGTHRVNGVYGVTFDATDTATVGEMEVSVLVTGALIVFDKFTVVEEAVYDAQYAASAPGYVVDQPVNVTKWLGTTVSTPTVAGVPNVNTKTWNDLATVALPLVPTTAGRTLDVTATGEAGIDWANIGGPTTTQNLSGTTIKAVTDGVSANVTSINSVSTSSVTAVNANLGTTQPVNFTGTGASALVKSDTVDIAGAAVSTSTAQLGVNVVNWKGSAAATVDTAGYPVVTIKDGTGQGEIATTAGAVDTVTTVTNLTNAATSGDLTATMKTSVTTAATAATPALSAAGVDAIWDDPVDGSVTARQSLRLANSANGGILSGAATTTVAIRDLADTKDRVSATVDASGNRTAVTRDLT